MSPTVIVTGGVENYRGGECQPPNCHPFFDNLFWMPSQVTITGVTGEGMRTSSEKGRAGPSSTNSPEAKIMLTLGGNNQRVAIQGKQPVANTVPVLPKWHPFVPQRTFEVGTKPGWLHRIFYLTASPSPPPDQPASDHVTDGSMFSFSPLLNCFPAPKNHHQQTKQTDGLFNRKIRQSDFRRLNVWFFLLNLSGENVRFFHTTILYPCKSPPCTTSYITDPPGRWGG